MDNVEISGNKVGGDSSVKLTVNTLLKIIGGFFIILQFVGGWAYFDLRDQLKNAATISIEDKKEFLKESLQLFKEIENEYDGKFEKMFDDVSEMKGDIKVILDRQSRDNPIQPNPNVQIQPYTPPSLNADSN